MEDLLYRCRHVVRTEVDVIRNQMGRNGVAMLSGCASFADPIRSALPATMSPPS